MIPSVCPVRTRCSRYSAPDRAAPGLWLEGLHVYFCGLNVNLAYSGTRHMQREMENQAAQVEHYQHRKREVEEDIRKNEDLLMRAHAELKKIQVGKKSFTSP